LPGAHPLKILVVVANYPSKSKPYNGIFVRNLLVEFDRLGHEVSVITPQKVTGDSMAKEMTDEGIIIFRPKYISFGNFKFLGIKTRLLSHLSFKWTVLFFSLRKKLCFDAIYSHFLFPSGDTASLLSERLGKPAFCSLGESTFEAYEEVYAYSKIRKLIDSFNLVFPNSRDKADFLMRAYGNDLRLQYVPNGVDTRVFFPTSKTEARSRLGLNIKDSIVIFVGGFIERKGPLRVLAACTQLPEVPKMIFIGEGPQNIQHPQIVFCGKAQQSELQHFLNAADVFVTPSRREGMPNALLEAMACSCRIVASDIPVHRLLLAGYSQGESCNGDDPASLSSTIQRMLVSNDTSTTQYEFQYSLEKRALAIIKAIENEL
jgi:teichuronic acid biosynthesis glycosyltransferase TuaC